MKKYKATEISVNEEGGTVLDLVNVEDENDCYMADWNSFVVDEIVDEDRFTLIEVNYVDDQGTGTGMMAFKK